MRRNSKIEVICSECGKSSFLFPSAVYARQQRREIHKWFCSKTCYGHYFARNFGYGDSTVPQTNNLDFDIIPKPNTIGTYKQSREWIGQHSREVSEHVLKHSIKEAMAFFEITQDAVYSSLFLEKQFDHISPSYLARRKKIF